MSGICENNSESRTVSDCRIGVLKDFEIIFIAAGKQ